MRYPCAWFALSILALAGSASGQTAPAEARPGPGDWVAVLGRTYGLTTQEGYFLADVPRVTVYRDGRVVWREEVGREPANLWREGRISTERLAELMALARRNGFFSQSFAARIPQRILPSDMPGDVVGLMDGPRRRTVQTHALGFLGPQPMADGLTRAAAEISIKIDALLPRPGAVHHPDQIRVGRFPTTIAPEKAVEWPIRKAPGSQPRNQGYAYGETVYSGEAATTLQQLLSKHFIFKVGNDVFNAYWSPAIPKPEADIRMPDPGPDRPRPNPSARTFAGHQDAVTSVAWSSDGALLATSSPSREDSTRIWKARTGRLEAKLELTGELLAWKPRSRVLAISNSGQCFTYQSPWKQFQGGGGADGWVSTELDWHPHGDQVATGAGSLEIWDTRKSARVHEIERRWGAGARWHPDGKRLCIAHRDGSLELYHVPTQRSRMLRTVSGPRYVGTRYPTAWRPDGKWLAAPGVMDGTVRIWETETGRELYRLEGHGPTPNSLAWSPDGRWLAGTSGDRILLWAPAHGKQAVLKAGVELYSVCWSPDGRQLAAGCADGAARIWVSPVGSGLTAKAQSERREPQSLGPLWGALRGPTRN